jgi:hypothetical protein
VAVVAFGELLEKLRAIHRLMFVAHDGAVVSEAPPAAGASRDDP